MLISLSYCEIPHKVSYSLITSLTSPPTTLPLSGAFQMPFWLRAVAHAVPSSGNSCSRQRHESFLHLFSVFVLMSFSQWEAFSVWLTTVPHTHTHTSYSSAVLLFSSKASFAFLLSVFLPLNYKLHEGKGFRFHSLVWSRTVIHIMHARKSINSFLNESCSLI